MTINQLAKEAYDAALNLPIIASALARLKNELPKGLFYHSLMHTQDVLREVLSLSIIDQVKERDRHLLSVAAAYHDLGFICAPLDNERIGAQFAIEAMQAAGGYSDLEIELVEQMILDTRLQSTTDGLRQIPSTPLSGYLLDADMNNLGRDDFVEKIELLRREFGFERILFLRRTYDLISSHAWHTDAAKSLLTNKTAQNVILARDLLHREEQTAKTGVLLGTERLGFLARLPVLLNSSLSVRDVVERSLDHLKSRLFAQAATVFVLDKQAQQLTFWALRGGESNKLSGMKMPAGKGVVGWVIKNNQSALVNDLTKDQRFFATIDKEGSFHTRNMICVPLSVRGEPPFGAIQALNREADVDFTEEDLQFTEQFGAQISLSLDNAMLLEKLRDRTQALEALEKRKNDVIALVTHEFRTPLNVIQNSADFLAHGLSDSPEERVKVGEALTRGVDRLAKLVSQMRNVSLIGSDNLVIEKKRFLLSDLLNKVISEFDSIFKDRNLKIVKELQENVSITADEALIRVVMKNLITNAIRFTADDGTITFRLSIKAGMAVVDVIDTGIGIEAAKIPLLCEKFYEVVDAMYHTSGDYQFGSSGLGLGLSAVRSILKSHGSALEIESEIKKGSSFRFRLPVS
jgi:signal transduction histidine kinase